MITSYSDGLGDPNRTSRGMFELSEIGALVLCCWKHLKIQIKRMDYLSPPSVMMFSFFKTSPPHLNLVITDRLRVDFWKTFCLSFLNCLPDLATWLLIENCSISLFISSFSSRISCISGSRICAICSSVKFRLRGIWVSLLKHLDSYASPSQSQLQLVPKMSEKFGRLSESAPSVL